MTVNQEIIYLDNAATTFPKPEAVYQAMDSFYRQFGGNAGRGANPLARKAAGLVDETRAMLRTWLNALEVTFAPSATIALNTVLEAQACGQGMLYTCRRLSTTRYCALWRTCKKQSVLRFGYCRLTSIRWNANSMR